MTTYISIQCDCHKDVPRCHRKRCILILFLRKHTSETKIWYSFSEWGHIFPKHNQCYTMQPRFHAMYTLSFYFFERERKKKKILYNIFFSIPSSERINTNKDSDDFSWFCQAWSRFHNICTLILLLKKDKKTKISHNAMLPGVEISYSIWSFIYVFIKTQKNTTNLRFRVRFIHLYLLWKL